MQRGISGSSPSPPAPTSFRVGLGLCVLLHATAVVAQLPHDSLGEVHLLHQGAPPISGPDHVKVVKKDGRLALEGATSVVEASLALSAWHLGQGQAPQAMKVVEAGLKEASKDSRLLGTAATIALELGEHERALGLVEEGLKRDPENDLLYFVKGRALSLLGRGMEGNEALSESVRLAPGNAFYQSTLGSAAYERGDFETALRAFQAASASDGRALAPASNLGLSLLAVGRIDEAVKVSNAVEPARDDPNAARAFANRGALYLRKQAWDDAERSYGDALALEPDLPGAAYNYGYLLYRRGELRGAREHYERALSLRADRPLAYLHLAELAFGRGDAAAAAEWLSRGETFFGPALAPRAYVLRGDSLRALGQLSTAADAYRDALRNNPEDVPTQLALVAVLRLAGDLAEARRLLAEARAQSPSHTSLLLEGAALARAEGDMEAEKATYLEILANEGETDGTWLVQLNLALILLRQGETADARKRLEPLLARLSAGADSDTALTSDQGRVLATTYGMLLAKEGVLDEATVRLQEVNRTATGFAPALQGLAVVAALGGDLERARATLSELRGGAQASAMADGNLGLVLWLQGRDDEAEALLVTARDSYPEWTSVRAALASVALRAGRFEDAATEASEAQRLCGDSAHENPFGQSLPQNWLGVTLGGASGLCDHVARLLGSGLVGASVMALGADPSRTAAIGGLLDRAMRQPLGSADEARARFVRGTLSLLSGAHDRARGDLTAALAGGLDFQLRPLAENNLGVALHAMGEGALAEQHFRNARQSGGAPAATLNLGVVLDERNENAQALRLYEEYLANGAQARRGEVLDWIENLKRVER